MSHFRISLGNATVKSLQSKSDLDAAICDLIADKIQVVKKMNFSDLKDLSPESVFEYVIWDKNVQITFHKKVLNSENILIVVQAAYRTFRFPNHISLGFVGRTIVDGIQGNIRNEFLQPEEGLLWEFT